MASNDNSYAVEANSLRDRSCKSFFVNQIILRSLTALFAVVSICVMVNSGQSSEIFGIKLEAKYSYSSAFRFLLGANIAICASSVISLITICDFFRPKSNCKSYFSVFLHDMIAMVLMMSGCGAATAIGYIGKYGQDETGWTKICDNVEKFCNYMSISTAFSCFSFICLFVLTIMDFKRAQQANKD